MTRPALTLLTALVLALQAVVGLSPGRAMTGVGPVAMCHAGSEPGSMPVDHSPASHDCLACPICAATAAPALLIPPPPELPRSSRLAVVVQSVASAPAPSPVRTSANLPTGPPRLT